MRLRAVGVLICLLPGVAAAWTSPAAVYTAAQDSLDPRGAVDANGKIHAVWRRNPGAGWQAWYSSNVSGSFSAPVQLSSGQGFAPVVACNAGDVHFAWAYDPLSNNNWEIFYRKLTGGSLGPILNASNTSIKSLRPAIAIRGSVGPVIAWDEALQADDRYDTFFSEWTGAAFTSAINISNTPGGSAYGSVNVNLVIAPNGDLTATWVDRDNPQNEYHTNVRRRVTGVWQARQVISTLPVGPATAGIATAPDSSVHIACYSDGLIYYQRWNGSSWTAPQALPGGLNDPIRCKLAVDDRGYAHVVADTTRFGVGDVYYTTNSSGLWSAWINISNTANSASYSPDISYNANRLAVVWQDNSNGAGGTGVFNTWYTQHDVPPPGPSGSMSGVVQTSGGSPVANANVACGGRETITAASGAYTLTAIPAGTYTATASRLYYTTHNVSGVTIAQDQTTSVNFTINPVPPAPVSNFNLLAKNTNNLLTWNNPPSGNFTGTLIRASTTGFPTGPADGTLVIDKSNTPGSFDSFNHTGLTNGVAYHYAAFAHNDVNTYAAAATTGPGRPAVRPDFDRDGDCDLTDFGRLQSCFSGPDVVQLQPACQPALLEGNDNDVDAADLAVFMACMSGPNVYASPACAD